MSRRWLDRVFLAAVIANLAPVLWFRFLPARDGAAHALSAEWIRDLLLGHAAAVEAFAAWNAAPVPNWLGHAFMALAGAVIGPWAAERLLVGVIVVALPLSVRYALRSVTPHSTGLEFLALPLIWGTHLHWGFYNFCISLSVYLVCVGYWWRHRHELSPGRAAAWALLLVVTYFSSILALMHVFASVGLLWLFEPAGRWRLARSTIAASIPAMTLWLLFVVLEPVGPRLPTAFPPPLWAAASLLRLDILRSGDPSDHRVILLAASAFWCLVACWLVRGPGFLSSPASRPWLALLLFDVAVLFLAPSTIGGGTLLTPRQAVFAFFAVTLWLASQSDRLPGPALIAGVAVCLTIGMHASRWTGYASYDGAVRTLIAASPETLGGHTLVTISLDDQPGEVVSPTAHAGPYVALARGALHVNQYELVTTHFPLVARKLVGTERTLRASVDRPLDAVLVWGSSLANVTRVGLQLLDDGTGTCRLEIATVGQARLLSCRKD